MQGCVQGCLRGERTTCARLGVDEADVGENYAVTQAIAAAALPGRETLAVFAHALASVSAERSEVPPAAAAPH